MAASDPGAIWNHVNTLIGAGHDYLTILNHYTLDHLDNFLHEIDSEKRRAYRQAIQANRTAQLDKKHYVEAMQKLDQQERLVRVLRRKQYEAQGHTPEEAEWMAVNARERNFSDLPKREQAKLNKELDQMLASIPPEHRQRAKELSGF